MSNQDPSLQPNDSSEQNPAKQQWEEMREERMNNDQDPALQSPQDSNTEKHIDFVESEETGGSPFSNSDEQSSAKEEWKEMGGEQKNNDKDPSR